MKRLLTLFIVIFVLLLCLTSCSAKYGVFTLNDTDRETFFFVAHTLNHVADENEKLIGQEVVDTAEKTFESLDDSEIPSNAGELKRYFYNDNGQFKAIDARIELLTAKVKGNSGLVWVRYSVTRQYRDIDEDGINSSGSSGILSYWKIRKTDTGWTVTGIKESP